MVQITKSANKNQRYKPIYNFSNFLMLMVIRNNSQLQKLIRWMEIKRVYLAALMMLGTILSFTVMAVAGRSVSGELDTFEIMLYRSFIGLLTVLTFAIIAKKFHKISFRNLRLHFLRNIFHFLGQNLWFFALPLIPLAQLFALEFTFPLWVIIVSPLLLQEKYTKTRFFVTILGFTGILLVTRPTLDTMNLGIAAAALAAIGFAGSIIATKKLTKVHSTLTIIFHMTWIQLFFSVAFAGMDGSIAFPSFENFDEILLIGLAGLLAHVCLTLALSLVPATIVAPMDFLRLPVIILVGFFFYNEHIDSFVIIGALLIFGSNYVNILSENKNSKM